MDEIVKDNFDKSVTDIRDIIYERYPNNGYDPTVLYSIIYSKKNKRMLEQMNITEVFDLITRKEDVKNKKPNPEIYNKIMQYYDASPSECLIFEDSYAGVLASKNAGIEVVNIYDKYADLDRKKINETTDYSIQTYKEFVDLVNFIYPIKSEKGPTLKKK